MCLMINLKSERYANHDGAAIEYVHKYATREAADEAGEDSEEADDMSSVGSFESDEEEPAGTMEV